MSEAPALGVPHPCVYTPKPPGFSALCLYVPPPWGLLSAWRWGPLGLEDPAPPQALGL